MQLERKRRDDAEVSAAAAKRPVQVGIFIGVGFNKIAIGQYNIGREEVIDAQSVFTREVSHSTPQSQPANTGCGNDSAWRRKPKHMRRVIDVAPCAPAADSDSARLRIDKRIFYRAEVD